MANTSFHNYEVSGNNTSTRVGQTLKQNTNTLMNEIILYTLVICVPPTSVFLLLSCNPEKILSVFINIFNVFANFAKIYICLMLE